MSRKKKKQEEPVVEIEAPETAEAPEREPSDLVELANVEGLDLEFAEDEVNELDMALASDEADEEEASPDDLSADDGQEHVEGEIEAAAAGEDEPVEEEASEADVSGTELDAFESAEIEDVEVLSPEQIRSVTESILFATDKPLSLAVIKQSFKGTQVKSKDLREAIGALQEEYLQSHRGFTLEEVGGGFQLRSKPDNIKYLRNSVKARPFKLSGPALEVMSIVAYKQPVTKSQIDEIRGVESGHLLRALMEKHLVSFGERSDLPGKPMFYETTRKFLEIFGLRNLRELPSLSEIDQLIPEGIGEVEDKETLSDLTGQLSKEVGKTFSEAEDELLKITDELTNISTSSEFFEQEKERMREKRDQERAQNLREMILIGENVEDKDRKWLERFEAASLEKQHAEEEVEFVTEGAADAAPAVTEDAGPVEPPLEAGSETESPLEAANETEPPHEATEREPEAEA